MVKRGGVHGDGAIGFVRDGKGATLDGTVKVFFAQGKREAAIASTPSSDTYGGANFYKLHLEEINVLCDQMTGEGFDIFDIIMACTALTMAAAEDLWDMFLYIHCCICINHHPTSCSQPSFSSPLLYQPIPPPHQHHSSSATLP